jgi:hypothetical protein
MSTARLLACVIGRSSGVYNLDTEGLGLVQFGQAGSDNKAEA